jgi:hypothetical protein
LSESRRRSVNEWYDNTLRSRLNSQDKGAIIIVMQRLHEFFDARCNLLDLLGSVDSAPAALAGGASYI